MSPHTSIPTFFVWAVLVSGVAGQDSLPSAMPAEADTTQGGAFDTLTGQLRESLKKKERPYLVIGDIEVPPGATVVIEPGTIFLFKNFTTLHIHGTLLSRGTKEQPIVFSSENDTAYNRHSSLTPAAYDWNGITVYENGNGTSFRHCNIKYSLYGINSLTKSISVETCSFIQIGKVELTIEGSKYENLTSDFVFNASAPDTSTKPPLAVTQKSEPAPAVKPAVPTAAPPRKSNLRFVLRYSGISLFGAGAALFICKHHEPEYRKRLAGCEKQEKQQPCIHDYRRRCGAARRCGLRHIVFILKVYPNASPSHFQLHIFLAAAFLLRLHRLSRRDRDARKRPGLSP
jgi:hypothetical protein